MRVRIFLIAIASFVLLQSCSKKVAPVNVRYNVNYTVPISNRITEPSVVSGFYGHVTEKDKKSEARKPSTTPILIFTIDKKEQIEAAKFEENGVTFYDLKKLAADDVLPKYKFIPNKYGFYQMDLGEDQFCILLGISSKKGFYPGGLAVLSATMHNLSELNINADY